MDLPVVESMVSMDQNDALIQVVIDMEIEEAIHQMKPDKAPDLDGFPNVFVHYFWPIIKKDVLDAIKHVFWPGASSWKDTYIILIPKKPNLERVNDFRPTYVTLYTKLWQKPILPSLVSVEQGAFYPGTKYS